MGRERFPVHVAEHPSRTQDVTGSNPAQDNSVFFYEEGEGGGGGGGGGGGRGGRQTFICEVILMLAVFISSSCLRRPTIVSCFSCTLFSSSCSAICKRDEPHNHT